MRRPGYGASPAHLLLHLGGFAFSFYVLAQVVRGGAVASFVVWFVGAALLHDLVLLPLYSLADHVARRAIGHERSSDIRVGLRAPRPAVVNHVRVPAVISGVLLLVYFPLILRLSDRRYFLASGHHISGYGIRWAAITAALFLASGALYGLRAWRGRR